MTVYVIKEVAVLQADRQPLCTVNGSLSSAKRVASRNRVFFNTVLKIEDISGNLIAYKDGNKWVNVTFCY